MEKILEILKALSDETRFRIIVSLLDGERCVCEIFPIVKKSQANVSIQLGKLESLGLIKSERRGKKIFYSISDKKVIKILDVLEYDSAKPFSKKRLGVKKNISISKLVCSKKSINDQACLCLSAGVVK